MAGTYEPFRNRVATDVVPVAPRDPAAFHSGLAEGLQELGAGIGNAAETQLEVQQRITASNQRIAMEQKRRDQSARIATLAGQWADVQVALDQKRDDLRNSTAGSDYAAKAGQLTTDTLTGFLDPLKNDPDVYERYAPLVAEYGARTRLADQNWATKQQALAEGQGIDKWSTVTSNQLLSSPTPEAFGAALRQSEALIGGLDLPPAARAKALADTQRQFARMYMQGLLEQGNFAGVRALLSPPAVDPNAPKPVVAGNIDIFNRPQAKNADGSISTVRSISIGTDEGEVLIPTVDDNGKVLSDKDAVALYRATGKHLGIFKNVADANAYAQALHKQQEAYYGPGGRPDQVFDSLLEPEDKVSILRQATVQADAQEREASIAASKAKSTALDGIRELEVKIEAGVIPPLSDINAAEASAKAAGVDGSDMARFGVLRVKAQVNREYGQLVGVVGGADRIRNARDALSARIAAGKATENDQMAKAQLDKLVDQADDKEVGVLKELAGKGTPGTLAALSQISGNREARYDKAEKIAPGLGPIAMLGPVSQRQALEGREVRKARPKDFGTQVQVETSAKAMLGSNILSVLGGNYGTVRDTAWAIMAGRRAASGKEGFDEADYRSALNAAMGATRRQSDGKLVGGVQTVMGKSVWAPTWQTGEDMARSLRNSNFDGAVYANGKAATRDDILANYTPVYVRDDPSGNPIYQFFDASGGYLARADKQPFVLRFTKTR